MATIAISRASAILLLLSPAFAGILSAQDTTPPQLAAFSLSPTSVNTAAGAVTVNVNFTVTDNASGVLYFEAAFLDPFGSPVQRVSTLFSPATTVSATRALTFQRFSTAGTWTVSSIFLADAAGNTRIMDTNAIAAAGFPTTLQVGSPQDTNPPSLTAFSINPGSVNTTAAPATVQLNFTATDDLSGVTGIQVSLLSPSGGSSQQASSSFAPSTTTTSSVTITLPRGAEPGSWTVNGLFLTDAAGNSLTLDTNGINGKGFPTTLTVTSSTDNIPPVLTGLTVSPAAVNTSANAANVTVGFSATDDVSGVKTVQVVFVSPTGVSTQQATVTLTPATSATGTVVLNFPRLSEAGQWTLGTLYLADAAGNTTILDTAALAARGFPTTLNVTSATDTTPPNLTGFGFTPASIDIGVSAGNLPVSFQSTDDLSGVTAFQVTFISPSNNSQQSAGTTFAASTSISGSVLVHFPPGSETGTWTVGSVFLSDAAGNTRTLTAGNLAGHGFPTQLIVSNADSTPPVINHTVNPPPNAAGWNSTVPLTVTWNVSDPESGIASTSGCGPTTLTANAAGITLTCSATNGQGLSSTSSVTVKIDTTLPVILPTVTPPPNPAGWNNTSVNVTWTVTDPISGIGNSTGCSPTTISTDTPGTTLVCSATTVAGLSASQTKTIKLDKTGPVIAGMPAPGACVLWPPNQKLVQVANITAADALSGILAGSLNVTATSNEPQNDPKSPDIVITPTNAGGFTIQLRADRAGNANDRVYTLNATAKDIAGNTTTVSGACTVPHDQGQDNGK
jgi:hypothetical protein